MSPLPLTQALVAAFEGSTKMERHILLVTNRGLQHATRTRESFRNSSFNFGRQSDACADSGGFNTDNGDGGRQIAEQTCGGKQFQRVTSMGGDRVMGRSSFTLEHVDGARWGPQCYGIKDNQGTAIREVREKGKSLCSAIKKFGGGTLGGKILQQAQAEAIVAEQQVAKPKHQDVS